MYNDTTIVFSFEFKASPQSRGSRSNKPMGGIDSVEKTTYQAFNYVVSDIAFRATRSQQNDIRRSIESRMTGIVMTELGKMARKISSQAIGLGPSQLHPTGGQLTIQGPVSATLARTDPSRVAPMSIPSVTGDWRRRTKEYLSRKARKFGHRKWWLNTGELKQALSNPRLYIGAYGPVRVRWTPEKIGTDPLIASRFSNFTAGRGRTYSLQVGTIHMSILGRITHEMLAQPGVPAFNSKFTGLFSSMPEDVENKLLGWYNPRPIIEPFLTYYINRQIPNRIWRALEDSIKSR